MTAGLYLAVAILVKFVSFTSGLYDEVLAAAEWLPQPEVAIRRKPR